LATPNEQVTLVFDHFKVRTKNYNVSGHYGYALPLAVKKLEPNCIGRLLITQFALSRNSRIISSVLFASNLASFTAYCDFYA
jgi:hypothetical protein